jgi:hypothetical protein
VLLDEPPASWPVVDVLISFFSDGFPLDKAIEYADLRRPVLVNDLRFQAVLWDRRAVLAILDAVGVPTPRRLEAHRDGGSILDPKILEDCKKRLGVDLGVKRAQSSVALKEGDDDVLIVDGQEIRKPFVEKPVSGEDHNIHIYFPKSRGGGGRRLFRKVSSTETWGGETCGREGRVERAGGCVGGKPSMKPPLRLAIWHAWRRREAGCRAASCCSLLSPSGRQQVVRV